MTLSARRPPKHRTPRSLSRLDKAGWSEWLRDEARAWTSPDESRWPAFTPLILDRNDGDVAALLAVQIERACGMRTTVVAEALSDVIQRWRPRLDAVDGLTLLIRAAARLGSEGLPEALIALLRRPHALSRSATASLVDAILDAAEEFTPDDLKRVGARLAVLGPSLLAEARLFAIAAYDDPSGLTAALIRRPATFVHEPGFHEAYLELAGRLLLRYPEVKDLQEAIKPPVRTARGRPRKAEMTTLFPEAIWQRLVEALDILTKPANLDETDERPRARRSQTVSRLRDMEDLIAEHLSNGLYEPRVVLLGGD